MMKNRALGNETFSVDDRRLVRQLMDGVVRLELKRQDRNVDGIEDAECFIGVVAWNAKYSAPVAIRQTVETIENVRECEDGFVASLFPLALVREDDDEVCGGAAVEWAIEVRCGAACAMTDSWYGLQEDGAKTTRGEVRDELGRPDEVVAGGTGEWKRVVMEARSALVVALLSLHSLQLIRLSQ